MLNHTVLSCLRTKRQTPKFVLKFLSNPHTHDIWHFKLSSRTPMEDLSWFDTRLCVDLTLQSGLSSIQNNRRFVYSTSTWIEARRIWIHINCFSISLSKFAIDLYPRSSAK